MAIMGEDPAVVAARYLKAKGMTGDDAKVASGSTSLARQRAHASKTLSEYTSAPTPGGRAGASVSDTLMSDTAKAGKTSQGHVNWTLGND